MLSWENDLSQHEQKSVVATFTPALNRIQQTPNAVTLLRLLCFCDPEGISTSIFTQGCKALHQEDGYQLSKDQTADKLKSAKDLFQSAIRVSKAIQEVQRLSLAAQALEGADRVVRIHNLVHLLLRSKLLTDEEQKQWLEVAICIVCNAFAGIGDYESPHN